MLWIMKIKLKEFSGREKPKKLGLNLTLDDLPPKRFQEEPVKSGPYKGFKTDREKYNQMLNKLYKFWEWDKSTGLQTRKTLESIGLGKVTDRLARYGKLV